MLITSAWLLFRTVHNHFEELNLKFVFFDIENITNILLFWLSKSSNSCIPASFSFCINLNLYLCFNGSFACDKLCRVRNFVHAWENDSPYQSISSEEY